MQLLSLGRKGTFFFKSLGPRERTKQVKGLPCNYDYKFNPQKLRATGGHWRHGSVTLQCQWWGSADRGWVSFQGLPVQSLQCYCKALRQPEAWTPKRLDSIPECDPCIVNHSLLPCTHIHWCTCTPTCPSRTMYTHTNITIWCLINIFNIIWCQNLKT